MDMNKLLANIASWRNPLLLLVLILVAGAIVTLWPSYLAHAQAPEKKPVGEFTLGKTMATARGFHTVTLLQDGRVLLTGGGDGISLLSSAETFEPNTGRLALTGPMSLGRLNITAPRFWVTAVC
jgi:hypothetical protein